MDNRCNLIDSVGSRVSEQFNDGWIHPYFVGHRCCCGLDSDNYWKKDQVSGKI